MKKAQTVLTEWAMGCIMFRAGRGVHAWTIKGFTDLTTSLKDGNALSYVEGIVHGEVIQDDVRALTNWKRMMAVRDHLKVLGYLDGLTPLWLSRHSALTLLWRQLVMEGIRKDIPMDVNREAIVDEKSIDSGPAQIWEIKT